MLARKHPLSTAVLLLAAVLCNPAESAENIDAGLMDRWVERQKEIETWSADLVQTRHLKALQQPLKAEGHVWYSLPHLFRWELGRPPQTIVLRDHDSLSIAYPRLDRVEDYPLDASHRGPWRDVIMLVDAGFPKSREQIDRQFEILELSQSGNLATLRLSPRSSSTRRFITEIVVGFTADTLELKSTAMHFTDGSIMRNDFTNAVYNEPVDDRVFFLNPPKEAPQQTKEENPQ